MPRSTGDARRLRIESGSRYFGAYVVIGLIILAVLVYERLRIEVLEPR